MIEVISKHAHQPAERHEIDPNNLKANAGELIVVEAPKPKELDALAEKFSLDRGNLQDIVDIDEAPRLDHGSRHDYLYIRFPYAHKDGSTTTRPLLIISGEANLIMIFPVRPQALEQLLEEDDCSIRSPQTILLKLLMMISIDYDSYIKSQSQSIKSIITKMRRRRLENEDFISFVLIEDQINNFRSVLMPTVPMLRRLAESKYLEFTKNQQDLLEDIVLATEQSIHLCNTNSARIVSIREAYATLSNNSLNRTMKTLTVATLLIAAPNLIFSMYGMNVGLPFQDHVWAYVITMSFAAALIIVMIIWARHRKLF